MAALRCPVALLAVGSVGAALASDWFVAPSNRPSKPRALSQTFTGLVVVAIASNAVEHAVGIRFALKAKPEYAISTTLNSPLQVALLLTPVLVLLSRRRRPDAAHPGLPAAAGGRPGRRRASSWP